ncbi:MAG: hypothetical protein JSU97_01530, partial [Dehalococcoidia bacterium]
VVFTWGFGAGASEAQQDAMHNCPQTGKWAIAVWDGPDGTDTGQALATCGGTAVAAYHLDPVTQGWERWFAGRPEVSTLETLDNMQGVIALGEVGAPAPTATPTPTPTAEETPTATPALTPPAVPTPVVFEKGDQDLTFYLYTASFELEWMVMGAGWIELTVFHQEDGSETIVCTSEKLWAPTSGSKACNGGPGDFRLGVATSGDNDWFVSITPQ